MNIQIKNRWTDAIIHEGDYASLYEAVAEAIKVKVDLRGANLRDANLRGANLYGADLYGAKNAELVIAKTRILPEGEIIGWKKLSGGAIAKLRIPESAKRSHAFGRKCRCSEAVVIAIYLGKKEVKEGFFSHDSSFKYEVGEIVRPKEPFSDDWQNECASGIHFFITRDEAQDY